MYWREEEEPEPGTASGSLGELREPGGASGRESGIDFHWFFSGRVLREREPGEGAGAWKEEPGEAWESLGN